MLRQDNETFRILRNIRVTSALVLRARSEQIESHHVVTTFIYTLLFCFNPALVLDSAYNATDTDTDAVEAVVCCCLSTVQRLRLGAKEKHVLLVRLPFSRV